MFSTWPSRHSGQHFSITKCPLITPSIKAELSHICSVLHFRSIVLMEVCWFTGKSVSTLYLSLDNPYAFFILLTHCFFKIKHLWSCVHLPRYAASIQNLLSFWWSTSYIPSSLFPTQYVCGSFLEVDGKGRTVSHLLQTSYQRSAVRESQSRKLVIQVYPFPRFSMWCFLFWVDFEFWKKVFFFIYWVIIWLLFLICSIDAFHELFFTSRTIT